MKTFVLSAITVIGLVAASTFGAQTSIDVYLLLRPGQAIS